MSQLQTGSNKPTTIAGMLTSKSFKEQMALALPKHMNADRLPRIALTEVRKNPKLSQCSVDSFAASILTASQLGLEIGSAFGQGYLVPFFDKKNSKMECQLIIGYRGMIQLAHRSGQVKSIHADVVYDNDFFDYGRGMNQRFDHVPNMHQDGKEITHAYAYAHLLNGGFEYVVLKKKDVEKIKASSKSENIWKSHYEEMAKKTALRRLFKMLPVSAEIVRAVTIEDARETGDTSLLSDFGGDDFVDISHMEESKSDALATELLAQGGAMDEE
jgi:recombination protein RecT